MRRADRFEIRRRGGGGGGRAPKRVKRPPTARVGGGGQAGCGTGKGGFGIGNNCAKEDGIPNKPLSVGGPLVKGDYKQDIQKAREMSAAYKKHQQIQRLRAEAAARKTEKGKRDAEQQRAAEAAAAKKRAEMLQKIRVRKANERISIVEAPPGKFSGQIDTSLQKLPGETQFDFAKRRIEQDLNRFHAEMEAIDARRAAERAVYDAKAAELTTLLEKAEAARRAHAEKVFPNGRKATKEEQEEYDRLLVEKSAIKKQREAHWAEGDKIDPKYDREAHDLMGEFVRAHNGGKTATFDGSKQFDNLLEINTTKSKYAQDFKKNAGEAWSFLSKVAAPIHQEKGSAVKVRLDTKNGDADYHDDTQIARHGTHGHGEYNTSTRVIVHEIAHGLHYGPRLELYDPVTLKPLPDAAQRGVAYISSPQYQARLAIKEDYDARLAAFRGSSNVPLVQVTFDPQRSNYKLWVPKGEKRQVGSYLGYAHQYCDAENGNATGATEVISVGVERTYSEPRRFRKEHKSHFDITLLFLAGRLH